MLRAKLRGTTGANQEPQLLSKSNNIPTSIFLPSDSWFHAPRTRLAHRRRCVNAAGRAWPPGCAPPPAPRPGPCASVSGHRERAPVSHSLVRGAPGPSALRGAVYKKPRASPARPPSACRSQPDNLIAFPRLRSITPRRRQNKALKGPAAPPSLPPEPAAGKGEPLGEDRLSPSAKRLVAPTSKLYGPEPLPAGGGGAYLFWKRGPPGAPLMARVHIGIPLLSGWRN